jgi:hypothetical protein
MNIKFTQTVSKNAAFEAADQSKHHAQQARPPRAKFLLHTAKIKKRYVIYNCPRAVSTSKVVSERAEEILRPSISRLAETKS